MADDVADDARMAAEEWDDRCGGRMEMRPVESGTGRDGLVARMGVE